MWSGEIRQVVVDVDCGLSSRYGCREGCGCCVLTRTRPSVRMIFSLGLWTDGLNSIRLKTENCNGKIVQAKPVQMIRQCWSRKQLQIDHLKTISWAILCCCCCSRTCLFAAKHNGNRINAIPNYTYLLHVFHSLEPISTRTMDNRHTSNRKWVARHAQKNERSGTKTRFEWIRPL